MNPYCQRKLGTNENVCMNTDKITDGRIATEYLKTSVICELIFYQASNFSSLDFYLILGFESIMIVRYFAKLVTSVNNNED